MSLIVAASVLLAGVAYAEPQQVIASNFPDPAVLFTTQGYYAFATQNGDARVPVAYGSDFYTWQVLEGVDALPGPYPSWIDQDDPAVWAPDVIQRDDGIFVMYFSYKDAASGKHCIGTANSESVTGPYGISATIIACPTDVGGAIDPSGFRDDDGTYYVVYKVDGNSIGSSSTPILLQRMGPDAMTPDGDVVQLIDRDDVDGPLVEAPSMIKTNGVYYLSFSSNVYSSLDYDVSYAYGTSLSEGFAKAQAPYAPLMVSGHESTVGPLGGPGGADFLDNYRMVFHAFLNGVDMEEGRGMWVADIGVGENSIVVLE